jgi:NAD(P)H-hydrate epimerase
MANGGSGDVLTEFYEDTGTKFSPLDAALIGTYIHGLAGNLALEKQSHESLIASDIIEHLGKAFQSLHNFN